LIKTLDFDSTVVDATCGNGHDTLFCCQHFKTVHAFDIQHIAIEQTKLRTSSYQNITLHHESFTNLTKIDPIDGVIFNLGYLPKGDESITTKAEVLLETLKKLEHRQKCF